MRGVSANPPLAWLTIKEAHIVLQYGVRLPPVWSYGAPSQTRTDDLHITSVLLYQLSYRSIQPKFYYAKNLAKKRLKLNACGLSFGPKKWHLSVYIAASQRLRN